MEELNLAVIKMHSELSHSSCYTQCGWSANAV